ncbi:MAG: DUF2164 domain-containing protein, partial [Phycisphaerae bacterium]
HPMRIRLTEERKAAIVRSAQEYWLDEFDEELSEFRAEKIVAFFARRLGPGVYNQAIQDARAFMAERLEDLEATFYEVDES